MTTLEEVKKMQLQGVGDEQIIQNLRERGVDYKDIADSLAQSRIKAAVEQPDTEPLSIYPGTSEARTEPQDGMERSIMNQQEPEIIPPTPGAGYTPQTPQGYVVRQPQDYSAPQQYSEGTYAGYTTSPDLTTEIAEQVVAERLSELRKHIEKIADMKATVESRIEYLDERLKRIEKIMDTLQSSVLRKVGDYVTNVEDIKREMMETQKTFAKLLSMSESKPKNQSQLHGHHQPHGNQHHHEHRK